MQVNIRFKYKDNKVVKNTSLITLEDDIQNILKEYNLKKFLYLNVEYSSMHASKLLDNKRFWNKEELVDTKKYYTSAIWTERFEVFYDLTCADKDVLAYGNRKIIIDLIC